MLAEWAGRVCRDAAGLHDALVLASSSDGLPARPLHLFVAAVAPDVASNLYDNVVRNRGRDSSLPYTTYLCSVVSFNCQTARGKGKRQIYATPFHQSYIALIGMQETRSGTTAVFQSCGYVSASAQCDEFGNFG